MSATGSLMPFGLHKGSGLALICALLAGGLSGGGTEQPSKQGGPGPILNHLFGVIFHFELVLHSDSEFSESVTDLEIFNA